jgi:hypothetical protein
MGFGTYRNKKLPEHAQETQTRQGLAGAAEDTQAAG